MKHLYDTTAASQALLLFSRLRSLLFFFLFLFIFQAAGAQVLEKKVSLNCRNLYLQEALQQLHRNYGINFSYSNQQIPLKERVSVQAQNQPLQQVLQKLFRNLNITYSVVGNQVVLRTAEKPLTPDQAFLKQNQEKPLQNAAAKNNKSTNLKNKVPAATEVSTLAEIPTEPHAAPAAPLASAGGQDTWMPFAANQHPGQEIPAPDEPVALQEMQTPAETYQAVTTAPVVAEPGPAADSIPAAPAAKHEALRSLEQAFAPMTNPEVYRTFFSNLREGFVQLKEKAGTSPDSVFVSETPASTKASRTDSLAVAMQRFRETFQGKDTSTVVYPIRPFQFTLVSPLGTNGTESWNVSNHLSFNLLAGYAAGLDGLELGAFLNMERDYVKGVQLAGFANLAGRNVSGLQMAGFSNVTGGFTRGGQYAGFMNVVADSAHAIQGSGFANFARGTVRGGQFAGFANITAAGMTGIQVSGFGNIAAEKVAGAQVAGFANIAGHDIDGIQVAGFMNLARHVKGFQVGVVNVADTVTGLPIGLLSIVRKGGYRSFEVFAGEGWHANAAFKIGVKRFYNIFALGSNFSGGRIRWGWGYGIGTLLEGKEGPDVHLDLLAYHINDNAFFSNRFNSLYQFRILFNKQLSQNIRLFGGPSFNMQLANRKNNQGEIVPVDALPPYYLYDFTAGSSRVLIWPGLQLGIGIN